MLTFHFETSWEFGRRGMFFGDRWWGNFRRRCRHRLSVCTRPRIGGKISFGDPSPRPRPHHLRQIDAELVGPASDKGACENSAGGGGGLRGASLRGRNVVR